MLQRRGTATQWANANPTLGSGEIGFETDTGQFKMGDNSTAWDDLPYFKNIEDLGGNLDDYILLEQKGAANGVATLDGSNLIPLTQISNSIARSSDVSNSISNAIEALVGTAPEALNTLQEIANAINDDQTYFFTVANNINNAVDSANEYTDNSISNLSADVTEQIELLANNTANNLWQAYHIWKEKLDGHYNHKVDTSNSGTNNYASYKHLQKNWRINQLQINGDKPIRTIKLVNCWPSQIGGINLDMSSPNQGNFSVTMTFDWFEIE
jgi:hypothetical protein